MGSAASGRYASEHPTTVPRYDRRPDAEQRLQNLASRNAWRTRFLREQNAGRLVITCQEAKAQLKAGERKMASLEAALQQARDNGERERVEQLEAARERLAEFLDDTLQRRRRASQQLRSFGISPQQEAALARELTRMAQEAGR